MGNCADLEIDEDELQEKVVIIDGLTIKEFEKQEKALNTEEESCDGDLGGEEEEGKEEAKDGSSFFDFESKNLSKKKAKLHMGQMASTIQQQQQQVREMQEQLEMANNFFKQQQQEQELLEQIRRQEAAAREADVGGFAAASRTRADSPPLMSQRKQGFAFEQNRNEEQIGRAHV